MAGVNLRKDQEEKLDAIRAQKGVSRSALVRWAVDDYIAAFFSPNRNLEVTCDTKEVEPRSSHTQEASHA